MTKLPLISVFLYMVFASPLQAQNSQLFAEQRFTEQDAVLISNDRGQVLYAWRADQMLVPASLNKLLTSYLAIEKWGLSHRYKTDFYQYDKQLWVKGYGDPYLVSEEIDRVAAKLKELNLDDVDSIHVDASYFSAVPVPGRSSVSDPYNAPLAAVAANFNTSFVGKSSGDLITAEPQTPLTPTARKMLESRPAELANGEKVRVNLINSNNAQANFAELLAIKLGFPSASIKINQNLPAQAIRLYRHENSHSLEKVLTGSMKYSNNFIANQVFLKLAEEESSTSLNFELAQSYTSKHLKRELSWQGAAVLEGAGLSRENQISAEQIDELLSLLRPYKAIFKEVPINNQASNNQASNNQASNNQASVFAKTGTLNGVSNYAGYVDFPGQQYRFVFMFNRSTPYGYRDRMLKLLVQQLSELEQP